MLSDGLAAADLMCHMNHAAAPSILPGQLPAGEERESKQAGQGKGGGEGEVKLASIGQGVDYKA